MRKLLRLMPLKPFRLIALVTGIFLAAFGFASATDPEPLLVPVQFDHYIHRDGGVPADPVNLVFLTSPGTDPTASVHHVLGWDVRAGKSDELYRLRCSRAQSMADGYGPEPQCSMAPADREQVSDWFCELPARRGPS